MPLGLPWDWEHWKYAPASVLLIDTIRGWERWSLRKVNYTFLTGASPSHRQGRACCERCQEPSGSAPASKPDTNLAKPLPLHLELAPVSKECDSCFFWGAFPSQSTEALLYRHGPHEAGANSTGPACQARRLLPQQEEVVCGQVTHAPHSPNNTHKERSNSADWGEKKNGIILLSI